MPLQHWSEDTTSYVLTDSYHLQKADPKEWGIYFAVYYNVERVGFFIEKGYSVPENRTHYWIYKAGTKVGGVVIAPNQLFNLFFIPPFNDGYTIVKLLKQILLHWSDRTKDIIVHEVLSDQIELFSRAGFWAGEYRCRWMQRPTEDFDSSWGDDFKIAVPRIEEDTSGRKRYTNEMEIAHCDYESFRNGINAVRRKHLSLDDHIPKDPYDYEMNEVLRNASTLVYDKHTNQLVGNCRLVLQGPFAAVYSIGVIPSYAGQGLATTMLKRALSLLKDEYPVLRLYVMQGNDAESVYYNLGFMPGPLEVQNCYIPASAQGSTLSEKG